MIEHKCKVNSFCNLNEYYKLWFCDICKNVTMVEVSGQLHPLFIKSNDYNKKDLSDETRRELI